MTKFRTPEVSSTFSLFIEKGLAFKVSVVAFVECQHRLFHKLNRVIQEPIMINIKIWQDHIDNRQACGIINQAK